MKLEKIKSSHFQTYDICHFIRFKYCSRILSSVGNKYMCFTYLYIFTIQQTFFYMSTVSEFQWHWDFLCGSISGLANCLSGYVFDTLKVKVQLNPQMNMTKYLKKMAAEGTLLTLFDGMQYPLLTVPLINAVLFGSYQFYKKLTGKTDLSFIDGIQNGAFAGFVNSFIVGPVELIKCKMQMDSKSYTKSSQCLIDILKKQGFKGLFRGLFATMIRQIPAYAGQFAAYQVLKSYFVTKPGEVLTFYQGLIVGAVAGVNCWIWSYPQDIIKTKLQVSEIGRYKKHRLILDGGFFDCGKQIYKLHGMRGFLFGLQPCLVRAVIANSFGVAAYERAKHLIEHEEIY